MTLFEGLHAAAVLTGILLPIWGAARWARRHVSEEPVEAIVAGASGVAGAVVGLWWGASLFGLGSPASAIPGIAMGLLLGVSVTPRAPRGRTAVPEHSWGLLLGVTVVATGFALLLPFLPYGHVSADGVHRMGMTDWYKHLTVTNELTGFDTFPPANPYLPDAGTAPYYYGFHLLAAVLTRLVGIDHTFVTLLTLTLLAGCLVPLSSFSLARGLGCKPRSAAIAAGLAIALSGFELIPMGLEAAENLWRVGVPDFDLAGLRTIVPSTHLDSPIHHDQRQMNAPYLATAWAPQHVLAAATGVLALRYLHAVRHRSSPAAATLPTLLLAATPMISVYVSATLALMLIVDAALEARTRGLDDFPRPWIVAGVGSMVLIAPFLWLMRQVDDSGLTLHVSAAGSITNGAIFTAAFGDSQLTRLLDTPAVFLMDLGPVLILGGLGLLRSRNRARPALVDRLPCLLGAALLVVAVVRPPLGGPNNLYARGLLPVWLLLAAAIGTHGPWPRWPRGSIGILVLASAATAYSMVGSTLEGLLFWATPSEAVQTVRALNARTPRTSRVVIAPDSFQPGILYWLRRPILLGDERHALLFGAAPIEYRRIREDLRRALNADDPASAARRLRQLGADILLVGPDGAPLLHRSTDSECFETVARAGQWRALAPRPELCAS